VPVSTITGGVGLVALAAPAVGFAVLLWSDQRRRVGSANRPPGPGLSARLGTGTIAALRVGAGALAVGVLVGAVVPTFSEGSLTTGLGGGAGSGGGGGSTGTSLDPVAELVGNLTLPVPIDLLRMNSSVADPGYLRSVTLDRYDNTAGWTLSNLSGEKPAVSRDRLAPLPPREQGRTVTARIQAIEHHDRFLPVPTSPLVLRMQGDRVGDWRFDPPTGTVYGRGVTTAGRSYTVVASEPRPPVPLLAASPRLPPDNRVQVQYTALPQLDPRIVATVTEVTAGAVTPYEIVRSIDAFLTDRANGFRYSLAAAPGTSGDQLVDFLTQRRGYCEQYAGTMAVMVRAAGIPARVALGYTPGDKQKDGTRLITSDDAHAWVEVYFQSLGWVPFDPTPIAAARAVTLPWAPRADAVTRGDAGANVPLPSAPTTAPPTTGLDRGGAGAPVLANTRNAGRTPWLVPAGAAAALVLLLVATPVGIRALRRRRRIAAGTAEALWDELVSTALDVGVRLQPSWTPRRAGAELAAVVRRRETFSEGAADAVSTLARAEEMACYGPARDTTLDPGLVAALRTARLGLLRSVSRDVRLRALLWPASLLGDAQRTDRVRRPGRLARLRRTRPA
jgi:transglutaminase-like putative cysteine protease